MSKLNSNTSNTGDLSLSGKVYDGPNPGEVFKDYLYIPPGGVDNFGPPEGSKYCEPGPPARKLVIDDLNHASRAEIAIEWLSGHAGTANQRFSVNNHPYVPFYAPQTPSDSNGYYKHMFARPAIEIPLDWLVEGENEFRFITDGQLPEYDFNWPLSQLFSFIVRVYYIPTASFRDYPRGSIIWPESNGKARPNVTVKPTVYCPNTPMKIVHIVGLYTDYSWEGNGCLRQWHYGLNYGKPIFHIGSTDHSQMVTWKNEWLPDQNEPMSISAIIVDERGYSYMTPAVENIILERDYTVKMYLSDDLLPNFCSHFWYGRKSCTIEIPDDLDDAIEARIVGLTHNIDHAVEISLNGVNILDRYKFLFAYDNHYTISAKLPIELLKKGSNVFEIYSDYQAHANEHHWPGPAIQIKYRK